MKRLGCVVEGQGDDKAMPQLCRVILPRFERWSWHVLDRSVRVSRGKLVDERSPSPHRKPREDGLVKGVRECLALGADAIIVVTDSDDDCPVSWGPPATEVIRSICSGTAVMAVREYESWLVHNWPIESRTKAGLGQVEMIRDAKWALRQLVPDYRPTRHQLEMTRSIDVDRVRSASRSFDKLVRTIDELCRPEETQ
jgi:hypothetical protein